MQIPAFAPWQEVRSGSRLCKNAKAINRDRTSYSFKTVSCAHIASAFNFEIEIKNIILVALRTFEFSHSLGHSRLGRTDSRSGHVGFPPIAIEFCVATGFREVPLGDIAPFA